MNFGLRHVRHFVLVAQELHFRRAAQIANVAQPALSRSVQLLENQLGVELFERNNRNVKLTAAGKQFLEGCQDLTKLMEDTVLLTQKAGAGETGKLIIGYTYFAMCGQLPDLLNQFKVENPSIEIESVHASTTKQLDCLNKNLMDFCFLTGPINIPHVNTLPFQQDDFAVIVHKQHRLSRRQSVSVLELRNEEFILGVQPHSALFNNHVFSLCQDAGFEPNVIRTDENHVGILGQVACTRGVALTSANYGCIYSNKLRSIPITGTDQNIPTVLSWQGSQPARSQQLFLDFVQTWVEQHHQTDTTLTVAKRY